MILADFLDRLDGVRRVGNEHIAGGPSHDDDHQSLAVRLAGRCILINCRSRHCRPEDIVTRMGLELRDLFTDRRSYQFSAQRWRPESPRDAARRAIIAEARQQPWARPGVLELYRL